MADSSSRGGGRGGGRGRQAKPKVPKTPKGAEEAPGEPAQSTSVPETQEAEKQQKAPKPEREDHEVYLTAVTPADIMDDSCRTFIFKNEGHTLGNSLRVVIANYPEVKFCGHTIPHPSENEMHLRIQTSGVSAVEVLRKGLHDLAEACEHTETAFQAAMDEWHANPDNVPYDPEEGVFKLPFPPDFSHKKYSQL